MKDVSIGKRNGVQGSSTLEILIALAVFALVSVAIISVVFSNQSAALDTAKHAEALARAEAQIETVRAQADSDWYALGNATTTLEDGFSQTLVVQTMNAVTKQVTSTVSWLQNGQALSVSLATLVTNTTALLSGDTCDPTPSGDWTHPRLLAAADIGAGNVGTDVDVADGIAYVTANSASTTSDDFYVIDVSGAGSSGTLPVIASLNTGPGLAAVAVGSGYAFVANTSRTAQFQIIDISDPHHPALVKSIKLASVSGSGSQGVGNSIFYDYANKRVYLGLTKAGSGPELAVYDVSAFLADPAQDPVLLGSWDAGTSVNAIAVQGTVAYLATPYPASDPPTDENLSVLDVSNPSNITRTQTFSYAGYTTMSGESLALSQDGAALYLGRGGGNLAHNPEFLALSTDSSGSIASSTPITLGAAAHALVVRGNLAFIATSDANRGLTIIDLSNSGATYALLATGPTVMGGMDCEGNLLYMAEGSNVALQVIGPS